MEKSNAIVRSLIIVVFITNISQLPILVEMGITSIISSSMWILMFLLLTIKKKMKFKRQELILILLGVVFIIGTSFANLITSLNHLSSNLIPSFYSSIIIFFIGTNSFDSFTNKDLLKLSYSYIISMVIVSLVIYFEVFAGGFNWANIGYAYGSKNSVSQMIYTSIIFLVFLYKPQFLGLKLLKYGVVIFLTILLLALKSRATIINLFFIPIILFLSSEIKIKRKITYILLSLVIFIFIFSNQTLIEIVWNEVLMGGRSEGTLNEISSGRLDHITVIFPFFFQGNEFFGTGTIYVESFPFNVLLKHGLFVGWILILIAYWPLIWGMKNMSNNKYDIVFLLLTVSYSINSLFEAQTPFGPGAKTYILWLMFGLLYGIKRNAHKNDHIIKAIL